MNANSVSNLQIKWWSASLTVFFTTLVFFISDMTGVCDSIQPVIRSLMLSAISVVILWGINMIYDRSESVRKK